MTDHEDYSEDDFDWDAPFELNGQWYKEDEGHSKIIFIKRNDAEKYPHYEWQDDERFPELVYDTFAELIPWKMDPNDPNGEGEEDHDVNRFEGENDFAEYHDLDPKDIVDP